MKSIFKKAGLVLCSVLLASSFAGCMQNHGDVSLDPNEININLPEDTSGELTVAYYGKEEYRILEAFVESFNKKYPNIKVKPYEIVSDAYYGELSTLAAAGMMPDVFWHNPVYTPDMISKKIILDVTPYWEKENLKLDGYVESVFSMCRFEDSVYCVPRDYNQVVTYINTDLFAKAGVEIPEDGWTWDDLLATCEALTQKLNAKGDTYGKGKYIMEMDIGWDSLFYPILKSFGVEITNEDQTDVSLDVEATTAAMDLVKNLVDRGYLAPSNAINVDGSFYAGQSAIYFHSRPRVSALSDPEVFSGNWDVVSFPLIMDNGTPKVGTGTSGYAIYSRCKNTDIAWAFLKHVISVEGQEAYSATGACIPLILEMLDDPDATWRKSTPDINNDAYVYNLKYEQYTDYLIEMNFYAAGQTTSALTEMFKNYTSTANGRTAAEIIEFAGDKIYTALNDDYYN